MFYLMMQLYPYISYLSTMFYYFFLCFLSDPCCWGYIKSMFFCLILAAGAISSLCFLPDPCCWGYIKFLPEKFLRNQIWKEFCQAQVRLRPTAACETACSAKKVELSYKKFDIDPPAAKLPGRQRADPPAAKLPGRQRADPPAAKLPGRQRADPPAAMCPRAESGSANLLIQQTLRQESCRRVCYVLYDCLASFSFSGMNQHHA